VCRTYGASDHFRTGTQGFRPGLGLCRALQRLGFRGGRASGRAETKKKALWIQSALDCFREEFDPARVGTGR
jgi:hypothetical protein